MNNQGNNRGNPFQRILERFSPNELTLLGFALGFSWSQGLSAQELNTLGNFILLIGQVMVTNAAQINFINSAYGNIPQTDIETITQMVLEEIRRKGNL